MSGKPTASTVKGRYQGSVEIDPVLQEESRTQKHSRPWREPPLVPKRVYTASAPKPVLHHSQAATRRYKARNTRNRIDEYSPKQFLWAAMSCACQRIDSAGNEGVRSR